MITLDAPPPESALYGDDLAYIHARGFADFARAAAGVVIERLGDAGIADGLVIDLGCGDGSLLREITARGFDGLGVEPSPAVAARARQTAPRAEVVVASAHDASRFPPCVAVTAIGEVLSYLDPDSMDPPPLSRTLEHLHAALDPGGVLVFDLVCDSAGRLDGRSWRVGPDWALLTDVSEDVDAALLTREIITFRQLVPDGGYRRGAERHRLVVHRASDVLDLLTALGFAVETADGYGSHRLPPHRTVFLCRR